MAPLDASIFPRQNGGANNQSCLSGGSIAGIVIGSIVGTLLIFWLIWTVRNNSDTPHGGGRRDSSLDRDRRRRRRRRSSTIETASRTFVGDDGRTYRVREPSRVVYKA